MEERAFLSGEDEAFVACDVEPDRLGGSLPGKRAAEVDAHLERLRAVLVGGDLESRGSGMEVGTAPSVAPTGDSRGLAQGLIALHRSRGGEVEVLREAIV